SGTGRGRTGRCCVCQRLRGRNRSGGRGVNRKQRLEKTVGGRKRVAPRSKCTETVNVMASATETATPQAQNNTSFERWPLRLDRNCGSKECCRIAYTVTELCI